VKSSLLPALRSLALLLPVLACGCSLPEPKQGAETGKTTGIDILTVGPGQAYALPSEAANASKAGDTIRIFPGIYADCATWKQDGLVVEGAGPGVTITGKTCDDKGLFIVKGSNVTIRNLTLTGAKADSHNGSGIRAEGANLTVEDSRFIDDEDGILAGDNAASTIIIRNSYFKGNGNCIAACAHGIYANRIARLRVEHSEFVAQHVGHHIKSRAAVTQITDNLIQDGPDGSTSYLVDLPNGGSAHISGNRFEKGPNSQNKRTAIAIRAEKDKVPNPDGEIVIENNSFSNDTGSVTAFVRNFAAVPVVVRNNRFEGPVTPYAGASDE